MSLEIALTKLAEAIEAQTNVLAGLMASSAAATIPAKTTANTKLAAADDADAEAAKKAKEEADKKAKAAAAKKAKEEAAKKAKEEAEKAADDEDDEDDLLGADDEKVYTLEQVREAMQTALGDAKASGEDVYKKMRETLSAALKDNGAVKVSDLAEDKFVAVMDAISEAKDDLL